MVRGSKYHGYGFDIPWVGDQNTMGRVVNIPWVGCRNTMGMGVKIPWVGGRNAMVRGRYIMVRGSKYHR